MIRRIFLGLTGRARGALGRFGKRTGGRQAWSLLWQAGTVPASLVLTWAVASAALPVLVVVALGTVVGAIPSAVEHGLWSSAGHRLIADLVLGAVVYAVSLISDPVGGALGTAASSRITGRLQARLLTAVSGPVGIGHLEDSGVLDRLARAEGSVTGYFPGDAPVTWVGSVGTRLGGLAACGVVAAYHWWLGLMLAAIWLTVRNVMLGAVIRQATELRGQTTAMRRSWYFVGLGMKARDAKEIRVFGLPGFVAEQFGREHIAALEKGTAGLRDLHRRAALCFFAVLAGYCVALAMVVHDARAHDISLRTLATVVPMFAVTMSAGNVSLSDMQLAWSLAGVPDVDALERELLREPGGLARAASAHAPADGTAADAAPQRSISFENVSFRYPSSQRDVLAGVDLELVAGTSTALVGPNGVGKSTLVSLLARLRDPTGGRITADGTDLRDLNPAEWQRTVAVVPQEPVRYPVSVYDNIAFGAWEHRDDRAGVEDAARLSGFDDIVAMLPEGWETRPARELPGGVDLSGGQWQRLALARALFATRHGARLLVLDEPTAALDARSEAGFYNRFLEITEGLTTVVISHRFATVRRAQVICVLQEGRITERGSHDELIALDGTYAKLYDAQASRFRERK